MKNCLRIASQCLRIVGFLKKSYWYDEKGDTGSKSSHLKTNLKEIICPVKQNYKGSLEWKEVWLFWGGFGFYLSPEEIYPYVVLRDVMCKNN